MARKRRARSITARSTEPLIAIPIDEDGEEKVRYFVDEADADAAMTDEDLQASLAAIGAWSDLDWDELADELDRIRRDSKPTPPIDL